MTPPAPGLVLICGQRSVHVAELVRGMVLAENRAAWLVDDQPARRSPSYMQGLAAVAKADGAVLIYDLGGHDPEPYIAVADLVIAAGRTGQCKIITTEGATPVSLYSFSEEGPAAP